MFVIYIDIIRLYSFPLLAHKVSADIINGNQNYFSHPNSFTYNTLYISIHCIVAFNIDEELKWLL